MMEKFDKGFFDWLREAAIKRMEEQLKAPWFYYDSYQLSPYILGTHELPTQQLIGIDISYAWQFGYDMTLLQRTYHLKIFLN